MSAADLLKAIAESDLGALKTAIAAMKRADVPSTGNLHRVLGEAVPAGSNNVTYKNRAAAYLTELNQVFYSASRAPTTLLDEALQEAAAHSDVDGHPSVAVVKYLIENGALTYYQLTHTRPPGLPVVAGVKRAINPLTGIRSLPKGGLRSMRSRTRSRRSRRSRRSSRTSTRSIRS
jgi:hypothetical protein